MHIALSRRYKKYKTCLFLGYWSLDLFQEIMRLMIRFMDVISQNNYIANYEKQSIEYTRKYYIILRHFIYFRLFPAVNFDQEG